MPILDKIKYHYNLNVMQDLISSNDYHEFFKQIDKLKNNKNIYLKLLKSLGITALQKNVDEIFDKKIIWFNSFLKGDLDYLSKFINFYFDNTSNQGVHLQYENEIISVLTQYERTSKITFNDFLNFSYLYQYLILNRNKETFKFLFNQLSFFSTPNNFNFTKSTLTHCYIHLIDHPYDVYKNIKIACKGDQNLARNLFLNLDDKISSSNISNTELELNIKGWHINTKSWTDPNVINSLNGKIILKKNLLIDPYNSLSSIILHLIQSGSKIKMDYDVVQKFIDLNPPPTKSLNENISNKEKKFLDQYLEEITSLYNFDS